MIYSKEYLDLQVDLARRAAPMIGTGLGVAVANYTGIARALNLRHKEVSMDNPVWGDFVEKLGSKDAAVQTHLYYLERVQIPFPQEKRFIFGCFQCTAPDEEGLIHIHFSDQDGSGDGPLNRSRVSKESRS